MCGMTRKDIIKYFGTQANAARRLGVSPQTILEWESVGVPLGTAYHLVRQHIPTQGWSAEKRQAGEPPLLAYRNT